ncbi:hypothetical protein [Kitasatospora sp. CB01950]|uniref:hypothetical protein n=1 Tax=Kitasatospora sp. CB01950 TaxID=1703930 RepID=UPI0011611F54|nr:hypothetical protein [Kitasatospora sp. CB01950]
MISSSAGRSRILAAALAATTLGALGTFAAEHANAASPGTATVSGSVRVFYVYSAQDEIRFTFDAQAAPFSRPLPGRPQGLPTDARGTVRISHRVPSQNLTVTADAAVDCLVTGGRSATLTAVVTRADPEVADWVGRRYGFSVLDGGRGGNHDRVGFSWGVGDLTFDDHGTPIQAPVGTCMAPAPFAPVTEGALTVHPAELPPQ